MGNKIVEFMQLSEQDRDINQLKQALQAAIELELSTLPPYLCGMWSVKDQTGHVATLISSVVREEMLHMGLACNMLTAIGGAPQIKVPSYPTSLPGGVLPDLIVHLAGLSKEYLQNVYMEIEYPEGGPVDPNDQSSFPREKGPTIGMFYAAILATFQQLQPSITTDKQVTTHVGEFSVFSIRTLADVKRAIKQISEQGEGTSQSPDAVDVMDVLAHYYRFGEIWHEKGLVQQDGTWQYTGDDIPFPDDSEIYTILPIPAGGYQTPSTEAKPDLDTFNASFTTLITQLQAAWDNGDPASLGGAINTMFSLQSLANTIMQHQYPGGGVYGPEFLVVQVPPISVPGFKANILPLFRPSDIATMKANGLDLSDYQSVSANANDIYQRLTSTDPSERMPCDAPWSAANIATFEAWTKGGKLP